MIRRTKSARSGWERTVSSQGLIYHRTAGRPYWDETAYYEFTASEIDRLEAATNRLHEICLAAGQHIIDHNLFSRFGIPEAVASLIRDAWETEPPAIYGRFDLGYDGHEIKLLEYNADTPTGLIEAAVIQWYWLQDCFPDADQFNSIHERLIKKWKELREYVGKPLYLTYMDTESGEDMMTVVYMQDTAQQAGHQTELVLIEEIGYDQDDKVFVDLQNRPISSIFKLYPWEWMIHEEFGQHLDATKYKTDWIEPIWKMMWSNKALLPILWELYPHDPLLLEAHFSDTNPAAISAFDEGYVEKPLLSREGANIKIIRPNEAVLSTAGEYGEEGFIRQALFRIPQFDSFYPVIGSWVIDGQSAGIGIRESTGPITDNMSSFVPHLFI